MNASPVFSLRFFIIFALILQLVACGFHLRGNLPLPEAVKHIVLKAPDTRFRSVLEDSIKRAGGVLQKELTKEAVVLQISKIFTDRVVGTLDTRGKANSYTLLLTVDYTLEGSDGKVIRSESLTESRRYDFDPEFVLETESEEDELTSDMEKSISLRLMRQLSSLSNYTLSD